ncbi:MAG: Cytidylyltransferase family protein [Methanocella sp. PtaU1.Bin125]|nr:MAG: Cytidylyltransferase family protein [Methanocella sp. PtaU1.Bin125]
MPVLPVNDVLCGLLVYAYVFAVIVLIEKLWKGDQAVGRKILHMSMGNIVFLLWLLTSPWTAFVIAGSFVVFTFLVTHRMQQRYRAALGRPPGATLLSRGYRAVIGKLSKVSVSGAGNEFGLVYYCVAFLALAFIFYDRPVFVAVGLLPLAYGDGMGAIVGRRYGAHPFRLIDKKTVEGSVAVFGASAIAVLAGLLFYGMPPAAAIGMALAIGAVSALVEAAAPYGLDNLAIPAIAVLAFLLLGGMP